MKERVVTDNRIVKINADHACPATNGLPGSPVLRNMDTVWGGGWEMPAGKFCDSPSRLWPCGNLSGTKPQAKEIESRMNADGHR
jgi:hypothetical protein